MLQNLKKILTISFKWKKKNAVIFFGTDIPAYTFYLLTKLKGQLFDSTPCLL